MTKKSNVTSINAVRKPRYMGHNMLNKFRKILTAMANETSRNLALSQTEVDVLRMPDILDNAAKQELSAMETSRYERNCLLVRNINSSLSRIDNNEYGYCDECGGEIGEARLEAQPIVTQCISCKTIAEIVDQQYYKKRCAA